MRKASRRRVWPSPGEGGVQRSMADEFFEGGAVAMDLAEGFGPGFGIGRRGGPVPVVVGPFQGLVGGFSVEVAVLAEVEDVALGDADVFDDLPSRVGQTLRDNAAKPGGDGFDGAVEGDMGLSDIEQGQ